MVLPVDLVLVRHGQSERNAAMRLSEAGNNVALPEEFFTRHTASARLTDRGRLQAQMAGEFLRTEFPQGFDRHITSEYIRAIETAGLLALPNAEWYLEPYLVERDWGEVHNCTVAERDVKYRNELQCWRAEPLFWRPPRGESMSELCLRQDRVMDTLHRCSDKQSAVLVCHGEVMWAFRIRIERLSQGRFRELVFSDRKEDAVYNCQIIHYTRRKENGDISPYMERARWIRPTDAPVTVSEWRQIERTRLSNADLLEIVSKVPVMIH